MPSDDYCDFCDLPLSQCIHGMPTPPPAPAAEPKPAPARRASTPRKRATPAAVTERPVQRRWTQPEALEPLIVDVLRDAGGELTSEEALAGLETAAADVLLPGDHERTPDGELRWHLAARKARIALIERGTMTKGRPGVWALA